MSEKNKKKTIKIIVGLIVIALIVTAISLIIVGFIPKGGSGHLCEGDSCTIPV